jgi:hypothetical protein
MKATAGQVNFYNNIDLTIRELLAGFRQWLLCAGTRTRIPDPYSSMAGAIQKA